MRRIRDRPCRLGQLPAFNTAAGEKINADRHLCDRRDRRVAAMVKVAVINIESNHARRCDFRRPRFKPRSALSLALAGRLRSAGACQAAEPRHAIAMHGAPALPADFTHMPYANPDAPKGGRLVQGVLGTFDSLNPSSSGASPCQQIRGYVVESLMARGYDEPFTLYGLLARRVETDDARSYVTFTLDPAARFSDGKPVTRRGRDVFLAAAARQGPAEPSHLLRQGRQGRGARTARTVRFDLAGANDRELPLILGLMPVLPKHAIDPATLRGDLADAAGRQRPLSRQRGRAGRSVTLTRNPDYWGRDLPVNRGLWNFDEVRFDYLSRRQRRSSRRSRAASTMSASRPIRCAGRRLRLSGRAQRRGDPRRHHDRHAAAVRISGLQHAPPGVRRHPRARGADAAVRFRMDQPQLLLRSLRAHRRATSTAPNCRPMAAPADARERALLAPFPGAMRADILDGSYRLPVTDGSGRDRATLRARARRCCRRPATSSTARCCGNARPGTPLAFEILVTTRDQERIALAFQRDLKRAGIDGVGARGRRRAIRPAPPRLRFRHDPEPLGPVAVARQRAGVLLGQRQPPTATARRNYMGVKNPAIDAMIAALLEAREHDRFRRRRCARSTAC